MQKFKVIIVSISSSRQSVLLCFYHHASMDNSIRCPNSKFGKTWMCCVYTKGVHKVCYYGTLLIMSCYSFVNFMIHGRVFKVYK